ncbi:MAG TPA: hypothetical protein VJX28_03445 [Chthoniobacterales bacterium]|nr:hypothetical protein [Chthoniobacterales bacterium]
MSALRAHFSRGREKCGLVGFDPGDIAMIRHERKEETDALIAKIQLRLRDFLRRASLG